MVHFTSRSYARPFSKPNGTEGYQYRQSDFPPLTQTNRIDEMSASIKQIQKCMDYLFQKFRSDDELPNVNKHFPTNDQEKNHPLQCFNNHSQHICSK